MCRLRGSDGGARGGVGAASSGMLRRSDVDSPALPLDLSVGFGASGGGIASGLSFPRCMFANPSTPSGIQ